MNWDYWEAQLLGFSNPYYIDGKKNWNTEKPMKVSFLEWLGMVELLEEE
jgi:hypothetical protein